MDFLSSFDPLGWLYALPTFTPWEAYWFVFSHGGWAVMLAVFLWGFWQYWQYYAAVDWYYKQKYIVLAIDVPKENEQGPIAVENLFSQMAGTHGSLTKWEKYWQGQYQLSVSFEIVSIDGYVQYVVYTPEKWRDMVEASVYAQYPDAEINEIEDYTSGVPQDWPDPQWRFFGCEFKLARPDAYPLRTWREFEDKMSQELKDPLAGLLEIMTKIGPGEQIWIQYVCTPIIESDYIKKAQDVVDKLIKRKKEEPHGHGFFHSLSVVAGVPITVVQFVFRELLSGPAEEHKKEDSRGDEGIMLALPPGEKEVVEAIEKKLAKTSYRVKWRLMYYGKNDVFNKARGFGTTIGALKQFNSATLNRWDIIKKGWPNAHYAFAKKRNKYRANKLHRQYKGRSTVGGGGSGFVLNIEELATLWHFPMIQIRAALVKKTDAKRAEAPYSLPVARPQVLRARPVVEPDTTPSIEEETHQLEPEPPLNPPEDHKTLEEHESTSLLSVSESMDQPVAPAATIQDLAKEKIGPPGNLPFV